MEAAPIEVTIEGGKITPVRPHLLPEHGHGWLTLLPAAVGRTLEVRIETTEDGLPVIRGDGPVITSQLVRELEASSM